MVVLRLGTGSRERETRPEEEAHWKVRLSGLNITVNLWEPCC